MKDLNFITYFLFTLLCIVSLTFLIYVITDDKNRIKNTNYVITKNIINNDSLVIKHINNDSLIAKHINNDSLITKHINNDTLKTKKLKFNNPTGITTKGTLGVKVGHGVYMNNKGSLQMGPGF